MFNVRCFTRLQKDSEVDLDTPETIVFLMPCFAFFCSEFHLP